jgi:hypothetical protein
VTVRLARLIKVRRVASRMASGAFVESAEHAAAHAMLVERIEAASNVLATDQKIARGSALAAQLELAERMRAACALARQRADIAFAERHHAAIERKAATRALDAVIDIRRAGDRAAAQRRERKDSIVLSKGGR